MGQFKLKRNGIILILVILLLLAGGGVWWGVNNGLIENDVGKPTQSAEPSFPSTTTPDVVTPSSGEIEGEVLTFDKTTDDTINMSLDEWIGWKSMIDANGGLTTQPGSIYDQLGIKVNISVINDATQSSNALINGNLDAAGYTINRMAFLSEKFKTAGLDVVCPYVTNYSNGGDGIIAKSNINSVEDLKTAKIGIPEFSEAHTLIVWFVNSSNLSQQEKDDILNNNLVYFATPDDAAKAFFAGQVDCAATWEPYLTQAKNMTDSHIFFSTASSTSLVMDAMLFRQDFIDAHPDTVQKFIEGSLMAADMYDTDTATIKKVMPMFSTSSDADIVDNCAGAKLATAADNMDLLTSTGTACVMYNDMCKVWNSIGEKADNTYVQFTNEYVSAIASKFDSSKSTDALKETTAVYVEENRQSLEELQAMLTHHVSINFVGDTAKFLDSAEATKQLEEFVNIAKVLDGAIIRIEGNTNPIAGSAPDNQGAMLLSAQRAETVKNYFVMNGISADRIITVGNGATKPLDTSGSQAGQASNRRTDISFLLIEG